MEDRPDSLELTQDFVIYCETHGIFELYRQMVERLLVERPADPLEYIMEHLHQHKVLKVSLQGPPCTGKSTLATVVCEKVGIQHVTMSGLIEHCKREGMDCTKAQSAITGGEAVDGELFATMVQERTKADDCSKGWLLEGLPETRQQSQQLARLGVALDHVIVMDVTDDAILAERNNGRKIVDGKIYNSQFHPPPDNLKDKAQSAVYPDLDNAIQSTRKRIRAVKEFYKSVVLEVDADQVIDDIEQKVRSVITAKVSSAAPCAARIVVRGPPGAFVDEVCAGITAKAGVVNVCVHTLMQKEIAKMSMLGQHLKQAQELGEDISTDAFISLVSSRLKQQDCVNRGWVMSGLPGGIRAAQALEATSHRPNRYVELDLPHVRAKERAEGWTVDTRTNIKYHPMLNEAEVGAEKYLVKHPKADSAVCEAAFSAYYATTGDFQKLYGKRVTSVNADQPMDQILDTLIHMCRT